MKILAFDTTSPQASVALLDQNELMGEIALAGITSHSRHLLKSIDFLLQQLSLKIQDIDGYAVAAGPGSFTGIRVGLSTAKALSLASGCPIAPVSVLKALAYKVCLTEGSPVAVMLDARKGEIFASLYDLQAEKGLIEIINEGAYNPRQFLAQLPENKKIYLIGSGVNVFFNHIVDFLGERAIFSQRSPFVAYEVGLLGWSILKENKGLPAEMIEPIYYRPSQAEERRSSLGKQERNT
ncbi:MAG: tRNA (adenosine(37)-N6)-threonylcarbamoyltransferase complex dimerization subunit type 1 TsaB [Candidatus Aminicenantes bacterium]|nr:tRNA (adenosine(37)-N6)-threonylcarbamoyltransferase complex dimerization subunit type 1 TsaB [Candidatus Aminicenantes bacterium]